MIELSRFQIELLIAVGENPMANCGIDSDVFEKSINVLIDMGQVDRLYNTDNIENDWFELLDDNPRMMQVFPTLWGDE